MTTPAAQFDPVEQADASLDTLETALNDADAMCQRIRRNVARLRDEMATLRRERESLEFFTEAEAAERLSIKPTHLRDLRLAHKLPHVVFGTLPRYTAAHLREIAQFFEVRNNRQEQRKAA